MLGGPGSADTSHLTSLISHPVKEMLLVYIPVRASQEVPHWYLCQDESQPVINGFVVSLKLDRLSRRDEQANFVLSILNVCVRTEGEDWTICCIISSR